MCFDKTFPSFTIYMCNMNEISPQTSEVSWKNYLKYIKDKYYKDKCCSFLYDIYNLYKLFVFFVQ